MMKRIHIFCEGDTEESFVREIMYDHFISKNILLNPIIVRTSAKETGGITTYGKIKNQIIRKCHQDKQAIVTTFIDFYALPRDFPGQDKKLSGISSYEKAVFFEEEFAKDINLKNFLPNLTIHEFEGLLFSNPEVFIKYFDKSISKKISKIRKAYETPEYINDDPKTAPSKRLIKICPHYQKISHGTLISYDIGLEAIRKECRHFNQWLEKLEKMS